MMEHSIYKGMTLKDVQDRFVSDFGNNMHLWICTVEEFYQEIFAQDSIRVLVLNETVIDTKYG